MNTLPPAPDLTPTQARLLRRVADGETHALIAADPLLHLRADQVGAAVDELLTLTGTRTPPHLAAWAAARRFVTDTAEPCAALTATVRLTRRQHDLLRAWTGGLSTPEIVTAFGVSYGTVRGYSTLLLGQLGVRSQVQAAVAGVLARLTLLSDVDPAWPAEPLAPAGPIARAA
ncbi:LuxR C-terminal-related transcriptional regulator [Kitasatospora sp. NPDC047058]|uniref:helix-turn-helix transcriptional regulator n=1 Tax=Kitasatospora sp. NPDC047058 TaxID=3155620 RepID=UPI0033EB2D46